MKDVPRWLLVIYGESLHIVQFPKTMYIWVCPKCKPSPSSSPDDFSEMHNVRVVSYVLFGGKMRNLVQETAFQIALRNCSQEMRKGASLCRSFATKGRQSELEKIIVN